MVPNSLTQPAGWVSDVVAGATLVGFAAIWPVAREPKTQTRAAANPAVGPEKLLKSDMGKTLDVRFKPRTDFKHATTPQHSCAPSVQRPHLRRAGWNALADGMVEQFPTTV
jgi:hypothetical protein